MEEKSRELIEALASFNNYYKQNLEDQIRVDHGNRDIRVWDGNDFFEEGFKAGLKAGIKMAQHTDEWERIEQVYLVPCSEVLSEGESCLDAGACSGSTPLVEVK